MTFLRSFSQRFEAQIGKYAKETCSQTETNRGTQDLCPAKVPPATTTKTRPIELIHATGVENLPKWRSTHTTNYRDCDRPPVPPPDTTASEPHSISMERPLSIPDVTTQRQIEGKRYCVPKP